MRSVRRADLVYIFKEKMVSHLQNIEKCIKKGKNRKKTEKTVFFVVKSVENVYNKSFIDDIVA